MQNRLNVQFANAGSARRVGWIALAMGAVMVVFTANHGYPISGAFGFTAMICGAVAALAGLATKPQESDFIIGGLWLMMLAGLCIS